MTTLLFIGDIVGEMGVKYLETCLPSLRTVHQPDFIVANAENIFIAPQGSTYGSCGMSPELVARLFALGVDVITGGNHSWDGPFGKTIHEDLRIIRPINIGFHAPGHGATLCHKPVGRLGVINVASPTALRGVDDPLASVEAQLADWKGAVDFVLVDMHGESVMEKLTVAYALAGRVSVVVGTHTHVPTLDTRILPGGTAYVSDVGMTGPSGGIQGYAPDRFVEAMRTRLPGVEPLVFAVGAVELGAVLVTFHDGKASAMTRL